MLSWSVNHWLMPTTHASEIGTENPNQKTGTINRHQNRALSYSLLETGTIKIRYQTAWQVSRKPVPVFGADKCVVGTVQVSLENGHIETVRVCRRFWLNSLIITP